MSLAAMLAAHNDVALEALASKGVLRRAMRDFGKGKASVISLDETSAEVLADGQTVNMPDTGPAAASCTCPAEGVCRHMLLAVLALRDVADDANDGPPQVTAAAHISELDEAELRKFAGADWAKAGPLVGNAGTTEIRNDGLSTTVLLDDFEATVTFISDQGLRKAVYKGKKTRQRVLVTLAALLVRAAEGVDLAAGALESEQQMVSVEFLEDAQRALEKGVAAVLPGRSTAAHDLFLDLSISSRVETLPRLSSELRTLAVQAKHAVSRDVRFEPDRFLKSAARTYALLEALKTNPGNLAYTGVVRRDYEERDALEAWPLGAARWNYASGARGVSVYAWAPAEQRWYSSGDGRASGVDPTFDPANSYLGPLWGAGTMQGLAGTRVQMSACRATADGAIALTLPDGAEASHEALGMQDLLESGCAIDSWAELYGQLARRFGQGLRRFPRPQPALIVPSGFGAFGFNDLDQVYEWEVRDVSGEALLLSIAGDAHETALQLRRSSRRIQAILVEANLLSGGLGFRPVTVLTRSKSHVAALNLDFDPWPYRGGLEKMLNRLKDALSSGDGVHDKPDTLQRAIADALDTVVASVTQSSLADPGRARQRCENAGMLSLAGALAALEQSATIPAALKAAYVASELEAMLWFDRAWLL